ncbi:hypothetical protein SAV31267_090550 [Streptomyces avermitilis]|uniref:Uncharacterized protein n=1 Tax=Streptomyces avermitilis TaxID=33903 RepID=A0A4D4N533_STRAX|nr:hypothetical protein SAV31267_090550 [Streptomyces avermitilis]
MRETSAGKSASKSADCGLRGTAGAAGLRISRDRQVQVERQAVRTAGYDGADVACDEGLPVAGQATGEVVVRVLFGEVTDQDLPSHCADLVGADLVGANSHPSGPDDTRVLCQMTRCAAFRPG